MACGRRAVLALFLVAASVSAQQATPAQSVAAAVSDSALERMTRAVASQLRCPVCQGLSIEDSPSELSQQMRSVVREQLRAGQSPESVKKYFGSKYGEWILLSPPAHGVNTLIYALPLLALVAGAALVMVVVRRWTRVGGHGSFESGGTSEATEPP